MKNRSLFWVPGIFLAVICCDQNPTAPEVQPFSWSVSTPAAQALNPTLLDSAFIQAEKTGFIDGLLVICNGYLVREKYYRGFTKDSPHDIRSDSKSFLSALVGIALEKGYLKSLDDKVFDYFPEYLAPNLDPRKLQITLRHLLTMRMGIEDESKDDYRVYFEIYRSANWVKTTLEYPLIFAPGERMRYNTFQTHLLSAIIARASNMSTLDFARKFLTDPLGITIDGWERDPQGYYFGGNAMQFTPREMATLGYLYLNQGRLNGVQIVPQAWVELTLAPSTNNQPNAWGAFKNFNYAWLWWLGQIHDYPMFMAYGYGGQFIVCFPTLNLVVVSTAKYEVDGDTSTVQEWAIFDIIDRYICGAIVNSGK
ncbi:beta-lactamase family protein [candidate division KSB1 bacterium]|nr:beta-lactamase family protein [candidate division KSB1 bacterium]